MGDSERSPMQSALVRAAASLLCVLAGCALLGCSDSKKTKVAGILFQEDQFFRLVEYGMRAAAKQHDLTLLVGNSSSALDKEVSLVDTYIERGVKAIVISPLSTKSSVPALQRAYARGIQVITYNTAIAADFPASNIESDQVDLGAATGKAARKYIEEKLGGRAQVILIAFMAQAPEQSRLRVDGFKNEIRRLRGVTIVAEQDAWLAPKAADRVESLLNASPDANLVWAANEGGTVGAVTAVRNTGKKGKVAVFGTDMSEQLADFLLADDNILQAVTGQKPFDIGSLAVETAVKVLKGETVEKQVSLPGVLFTRDKPDEVRAYKKFLQELTQ